MKSTTSPPHRDRIQDLGCLFRPGSVAVVGALCIFRPLCRVISCISDSTA